MLISVHIPKTAGTSFRRSLESVFGDRFLLVYADDPGRPSLRIPPTILPHNRTNLAHKLDELRHRFGFFRKRRELVGKYDAIHGHLLSHWFKSLPCPQKYCVFLRDPVEWVISHYLHLMEAHAGTHPKRPRWSQAAIINHMSLNDFAEAPAISDFFSQYVCGVGIERFDFVGLVEEYETSLRLFEKIFGCKMAEERLNIRPRDRFRDLLAEVDMDRLRRSQEPNRKLYDQGRRRFEQLCSRYL